jgi:hypothetical protein
MEFWLLATRGPQAARTFHIARQSFRDGLSDGPDIFDVRSATDRKPILRVEQLLAVVSPFCVAPSLMKQRIARRI